MPDDDAPAFDRLDEEAYQRALAILLDVGTSIARELKQADPAVSVAARAAAFDRVALAIRRTIILSQHVAASAVAAAAAAAERVRRRKHLLRTVEEKIDQLAPPEQVPELRRELLERLDQPETDDDLTHLPPHKVLAMICADLGLQEYANTPTPSPHPRRHRPALRSGRRRRRLRPPPMGRRRLLPATPPRRELAPAPRQGPPIPPTALPAPAPSPLRERARMRAARAPTLPPPGAEIPPSAPKPLEPLRIRRQPRHAPGSGPAPRPSTTPARAPPAPPSPRPPAAAAASRATGSPARIAAPFARRAAISSRVNAARTSGASPGFVQRHNRPRTAK